MICFLTCDFVYLLTWFVKVIEIRSEEFLSARTHEIIPEVWLNNYCLYQAIKNTGCPVRTLDTEHSVSTSDCSETTMWLKSRAEESWSKAWVQLKILKILTLILKLCHILGVKWHTNHFIHQYICHISACNSVSSYSGPIQCGATAMISQAS